MCLVCTIQETESVEYNSFGIPQVIVLKCMIKNEHFLKTYVIQYISDNGIRWSNGTVATFGK